MILADALSLRKELSTRVQRLVSEQYSFRASLTPIRISSGESTEIAVQKAVLPSLSAVCGETLHAVDALRAVETAVSLANATTLVEGVPLAFLLAKRKALKSAVDFLTTIQGSCSQGIKTGTRTSSPGTGFDDVMVSVPPVHPTEIRAALAETSERLRLTDSRIQRANWATEVPLPDWVGKAWDPATTDRCPPPALVS